MADADSFLEEETAAHSYFVPIVDMLAGIVFLLVIMLAASLLVSRPEFGQTEQMQAETARISKKLQQAKADEQRYIEPRRQARIAMGTLLDRLSTALRGADISVEANPDQGTLTVNSAALFEASGSGLSDKGKALAISLAVALSRELPCLAKMPSGNTVQCSPYGSARLDDAIVMISQNGANTARAQALEFLSAIASAAPRLMALEAPDGAVLLSYGATSAEPGAPPTGGSPTMVTLQFRMDVPAIP